MRNAFNLIDSVYERSTVYQVMHQINVYDNGHIMIKHIVQPNKVTASV
jgi:hypothetical protein